MKDCKFCEAITDYNRIVEITQSQQTKDELEEFGKFVCEYSAALVLRRYFKKKGKRNASRTVDFRRRGLGFELNYCPECGRRIKNEGGNKCKSSKKIKNG